MNREDRAVEDATELACLVRDYGQDTITRFLRARDRGDLEALCVALAAMVPVDSTPAQLLAWLQQPSRVAS